MKWFEPQIRAGSGRCPTHRIYFRASVIAHIESPPSTLFQSSSRRLLGAPCLILLPKTLFCAVQGSRDLHGGKLLQKGGSVLQQPTFTDLLIYMSAVNTRD